MKHKLILLAAFMLAATSLFAQSADNEDEVIKIDKWNQNAYREGEILVKFKADGAVQMRAPRKTKFQTAQVNAVDALFAELGVDSVEQLMPRTGHKNVGRRVKAYNGSEVEVKDLSKLYRLTLKPKKNIHEAIDKLKALEEVEFAEPNYVVYAMALPYNDSIPTADSAVYVNEPLYSQQWGISAINLPQLWNKPKRTNKRPVIAILDTGVDIEHPDLAANIWTNTTEAHGVANQDDDANGFKDDIHGWDFINQTGVIKDFNGHGTHCAGIAAAVGNNGIGITGSNPDAYIMPVTVMQSNGTGDVATIVKGIDYASANGANVISMSLGGYSYSIAEEQALGHAYANAVLVAAAGNDGCCWECCAFCPTVPMFPAGFTFVLGVEASSDIQGTRAVFSNYDCTGPIYSTDGEEQLYNYELRAPGVNVLSTFPGGRYKTLNGTSMSCPLVAGAISRLIQCKEFLNKELLFGDLIHRRQGLSKLGNIDIYASYSISDIDRHPELSLISANLTDTASGDRDNRADAGETIEFYPIFKNAWGQAENIRFWVKSGYYMEGDWVWDDTTLVTHLQDTVNFGKPLSSYAKATSLNPWRLTVSHSCVDGRKINLTFFAICDNAIDTIRQHVVLEVENGVEIGGMITEDMTLYPNVHYIVTKPLAIPAGVTLTIKPGTIIKLKDGTGISSSGNIVCNGNKDSLIVFTNADLSESTITPLIFNASYAKVSNLTFSSTGLANPAFMGNWENSIIEYCNGLAITGNLASGYFYDCNFFYNYLSRGVCYGYSLETSQSFGNKVHCCNVINNFFGGYSSENVNEPRLLVTSNVYNNVIRNRPEELLNFSIYSTTPCVIKSPNPSYLGTGKETTARVGIYDINKESNDWTSFALYDISNMLLSPVNTAHGIVWKILVDGVDAQDEFEFLPPIGVGQHRCDVYFNRAMDTTTIPTISYGVRQPYTQHQVADSGSWSADSTIYTAYFTIDAKTVSDGLNRFKVYGAEDDEHFEIPEESYRFHMEIAAAGSMSTGLMAEAGLGKVTLKWETDEEDFADLLGYNLYRWTTDTIKQGNTWRFDTICINPTLIDASDSSYIDYDVVPGKDYYYVIRQMTTSLDSYDLSTPVVARPLTAIKGDANGSMAVDVADVITEVNYITHQNPQPFIFEAADVNNDAAINIFDVVGTINIIRHPQAQNAGFNDGQAIYYIENGILYVETDVVLGGVQFTFAVDSPHVFTPLEALNGFELVSEWTTSDTYLFMAYSMSGKTIGVGKNALLQIGEAELTSIALSDTQGHNVPAVPSPSTALDGTLFMPCSNKYIENGNFFIKIGDHIYNAIGVQIK